MKLISVFLVTLGLILASLVSKFTLTNVLAVGCDQPCTQTANCDPPNNFTTVTCSIRCGSTYCVGDGSVGVCSCTTATSTFCPPGSWSGWSACTPEGYQIRWCLSHGADTQIQSCPAPTGTGGPGGPTPPGGSIPPGCTVGAWSPTTCGAGTCAANQMQFVRTVSPAGCAPNTGCAVNPSCTSATPPPSPTCTISLSPSTLNLTTGGATGTITATVTCNVPVNSVTFTTNNGSVATVSPGSDTSAPYTTIVTPVGPGSTIITGSVYAGGVSTPLATDTTVVNSTPPDAWWQVIDADVTTGTDLSVDLPAGEVFDLDGAGGFPGIPSYAGSTNLTNSNVSGEGWLVRTTSTTPKVYDYEALSSQVPPDIRSTFNIINAGDNVSSRLRAAGATRDSENYYWFFYDGAVNGNQTLTLNATNLGSRKAILLVKDANVNITGNVTLDNGVGFFMLAVDGNINVSTSVGGGSNPNLEGIYETDGTFSTGLDNTSLYIRGSVVAYGGVNMQRDLGAGNVTNPAEIFEYGPDQILLYPSKLGVRRIEWKEVAPN